MEPIIFPLPVNKLPSWKKSPKQLHKQIYIGKQLQKLSILRYAFPLIAPIAEKQGAHNRLNIMKLNPLTAVKEAAIFA